MTDETDSPATEITPAPAAVAPPPVLLAGEAPASESALGAAGDPPQAHPQAASDRPELIVAGAFAAGFVIAMILKRLGH